MGNPSIFNSFPAIRPQVQKIAVFTYRSPRLPSCVWGRGGAPGKGRGMGRGKRRRKREGKGKRGEERNGKEGKGGEGRGGEGVCPSNFYRCPHFLIPGVAPASRSVIILYTFTAVYSTHYSQLDLNSANLEARSRMDSGVSLSSNFTAARARCLICKVK